MGGVLTITASDGTRLHVTDDGEGRPVVLLHGLACDGSMFDAVRTELCDHRRVLVMDLRGHRNSRPVHGGFSLEQQADDVRALLEQLDLRDVTLVGHSAGGYAALAFAAAHPTVVKERVAALMTFGTSPSLDGLRERLVLGVSATRLFYALMRNGAAGRSLVRVGAFGVNADPTLVERTRKMAAACPREVKRAWVKAIAGTSVQPGHPALEAPLHLVTGSRDTTVAPNRLGALAELVGAHHSVIDGAGHMAPLERPADVARLIAGA